MQGCDFPEVTQVLAFRYFPREVFFDCPASVSSTTPMFSVPLTWLYFFHTCYPHLTRYLFVYSFIASIPQRSTCLRQDLVCLTHLCIFSTLESASRPSVCIYYLQPLQEREGPVERMQPLEQADPSPALPGHMPAGQP